VARNPEETPPVVQVRPPESSGGHIPDLPQTPFARAVDPVVAWIGKASSVLWPLLVAVIALNVLMRYALGSGRIEFEEIQWHLFAAGFLLPLGWCLLVDAHVRIDVAAEHYPRRTKLWIELACLVLWLLPFIALVTWYSVPFVAYSFRINEVSEAPGGLPYRWIIKSFLLLGFVVLGAAAVSRLTRVVAGLFGPRKD
jgi:TRAP-type mannitol/chloroaromatic compound transport system permease small subunit